MSVAEWMSGRLFQFVQQHNLVYNACWEDPRLDRVALDLGPDDTVLVITSAGCNALDYALACPGRVIAVDLNPRQNALLERHPDLRADIVIAGLPSMDEPVCDGLIQAVKPQWVIIADSEVPVSRRAPAKCRERLLRQCGGRALFCSDTGALALVFSASGWRVEDASGQPVELAPRRAPPVSTAPDEAPPGSEDEED